MNKVLHLSSCDTCQRILKDTNAAAICELQDIKTTNISAEELDELAAKVGSYEALFSKRALKYRAMGLHEKTLLETDFRDLMLQEYTFLRRPFIIIGENVFIGNAPKTVEAAKDFLSKMI